MIRDRVLERSHVVPVDVDAALASTASRLPYEPLAGLLAPVTVRPWLPAIFDHRARQTGASLR